MLKTFVSPLAFVTFLVAFFVTPPVFSNPSRVQTNADIISSFVASEIGKRMIGDSLSCLVFEGLYESNHFELVREITKKMPIPDGKECTRTLKVQVSVSNALVLRSKKMANRTVSIRLVFKIMEDEKLVHISDAQQSFRDVIPFGEMDSLSGNGIFSFHSFADLTTTRRILEPILLLLGISSTVYLLFTLR